VFFDDTGTPAYWDFLASGTMTHSAPHDLAPGETYVLNSGGANTIWAGNSTKLRVVVDFSSLTTAPDLRSVPTADSQAAAALQARRSAITERLR
jgi:hypothetical protein